MSRKSLPPRPTGVGLVCLVFLSGIALSGCAGPSYMMDTPRVFKVCSGQGENPARESFDAVVKALAARRREWKVDGADSQKLFISARVCASRICERIDFTVLPDGNVEALRADPMNAWWDDATLKNWMDTVETLYDKERCK
jgi:hypothetical protein